MCTTVTAVLQSNLDYSSSRTAAVITALHPCTCCIIICLRTHRLQSLCVTEVALPPPHAAAGHDLASSVFDLTSHSLAPSSTCASTHTHRLQSLYVTEVALPPPSADAGHGLASAGQGSVSVRTEFRKVRGGTLIPAVFILHGCLPTYCGWLGMSILSGCTADGGRLVNTRHCWYTFCSGVCYRCLGHREGAYNPCPKWARIYRLMTESGSKAFPASRAPEV